MDEFLEAFDQKQIRGIKRQNPIDHANRIERLREMEAKRLGTVTAPAPVINITTPLPKAKEELNPAFKKPEKLKHLKKLSKKDAVPGLFIYCHHPDCLKKKKCNHPADLERYKFIIKTKTVSATYKKEFWDIRDEEEAKALARELRRITLLNGGKPKSLTVQSQGGQRDLQ